MYRNVYWHHAVRSATAMFKRLVREAIARGDLDAAWIAHTTDEALMEALHRLAGTPLAQRLRRRRLYKRALDLPATDLPDGAGGWMSTDPDLMACVEDRLAGELKLERGELLLDFPSKPEMLAVELPVVTKRGGVEPAQLGLQPVAEMLHRSARRLRVFTAEPRTVDAPAVVGLAQRTAAEVRAVLAADQALLSPAG